MNQPLPARKPLTSIERQGAIDKIAHLRATGFVAEAQRLEIVLGLNSPHEKVLTQFITEDPAMLSVKEEVRVLAPYADTVLIVGPTGTGKELLARALHGPRAGHFIAQNCAGIPDNLLESELFGYAPGAFTGANTFKQGLINAADGGTFFLDEIGELPLTMQAKLLRVLQERKLRPVGSNEIRPVTCRFVCATHRNLIDMIDKGLFREDLYARISVFELRTTPLKERLVDCRAIIKALDPAFPVDTLDVNSLDLRFNVRSLERLVKRWQVFGDKALLA